MGICFHKNGSLNLWLAAVDVIVEISTFPDIDDDDACLKANTCFRRNF